MSVTVHPDDPVAGQLSPGPAQPYPSAPPAPAEDSPTGPGRAPRRSARDWAVDTIAVLVSLAAGALFVGAALLQPDPPSGAVVGIDVLAGVVGCLALWWRRRWPVGVAVLLLCIGSFSDMGSPAGLVALFTVAVHRRWPTVLAVYLLNCLTLGFYTVLRPVHDMPLYAFWVMTTVVTGAAVAWGMFVRARRQLVDSLRDRALRAESEQHLRVAQAQQRERTRIAREMHDVLAHRLSLLSMHAGALEFRPDAPPAEIAAAAGVVRASARQALEDLREVIGVLRDNPDGSSSTRPQPTLGDLPALVEECRRAGVRVRAEYRVAELDSAPAAVGRTAYRVVQEGLTNVRKHAPGTVASLRVEGGPGTGLTVEVRNPVPAGGEHVTPLPSAGTGLVGLLERVGLTGGHLAHGWTADGAFLLRASLPWPDTPGPAAPTPADPAPGTAGET